MKDVEFVGKCLIIGREKERILAIGDLHMGYEEFLNRRGVLVSRKMLEEVVWYLEEVFRKSGRVERVILLGDVKHDFGKIMRQEWDDVLCLFDYLLEKCKEIVIVRGNHDKIIEPIAKKGGVKVVEHFIWKEFCFLHGDRDLKEAWGRKVKYWILGHGHPAVKISGGTKVEKYKCFLVGKFKGRKVIIVPSFFPFTAGSDPRENNLKMAWKFNLNRFRVIVGEGLDNFDFGKLGEMRRKEQTN